MSAFVVSKDHIDALIAAGLSPRYQGDHLSWWPEPEFNGEWRKLTHSNADAIGAMLWAENVASVEHRYSPPGREAIYGEGWETPNESLPGKYVQCTIAEGVEPVEFPEYVMGYRFPLGRVRPRPPVEVLKLISCFEYQSCEHDGWEASEAKRFCDALRDQMIGQLPGYDAAPWGL